MQKSIKEITSLLVTMYICLYVRMYVLPTYAYTAGIFY